MILDSRSRTVTAEIVDLQTVTCILTFLFATGAIESDCQDPEDCEALAYGFIHGLVWSMNGMSAELVRKRFGRFSVPFYHRGVLKGQAVRVARN